MTDCEMIADAYGKMLPMLFVESDWCRVHGWFLKLSESDGYWYWIVMYAYKIILMEDMQDI